jgi:hypothetical protein
MPQDPTIPDDEKLRGSIATKVLLFGTLILCIIAAIIVIAGITLLVVAKNPADTDKALNLILSVFHALLPVIATWVGTVIAFYFGKANFEAASKSTQDLVMKITNSDDKLRSTKVSDDGIMRPFNQISYNKAIAGKADKDINVQKDLLEFIDAGNKGDRLPIFNDKNIIRYILHESTINEFARKLASGQYPSLSGKKLEDITLDQMTSATDDEMNSKVNHTLVFVSKNSTLFDANEKMKSNKWSQDVFITETGAATEPVLGWITNNRIADLSKI